MGAALDHVVDVVARHGMARERAELIAEYIADRCAGFSLTTVHSSGHSSLHRDGFLLRQMGLRPRQIGAWLALIRGTRPVRDRAGRLVGGRPGLLEAASTGHVTATDMRRFDRLAFVAVHGHRPPPPGRQLPAQRRVSARR